jgi:sugar phosphate isomerase/epimerase
MKREWTWAVTGYQFPDRPHAEIIETCLHAGASSVEATPAFVADRTVDERDEVKRQYQQAGLMLDTLHLPFGPEDDIAAFYETPRRRAVEHMKRVFTGAAALGSRAVILHPTTCSYSVEAEGMDRYLHHMGRSLRELIPRAEQLDLTIALENMLPGQDGARLGSRPEHFVRFAREFGAPNLGFCLDTGHAFISEGAGGPGTFFDAMEGHLVAFHLQDNAGDRDSHLAPGHGLIDWKSVFERISKMHFPHSVCIESPPFCPGPNFTYPADAWKQMIEEIETFIPGVGNGGA